MPAVLKTDAIRLIEAAREFYTLALHGIVLPHFIKNRSKEAQYSPSAGMLGAAIELAIKCCLVQAKGKLSIFCGETKYKQASSCLDEFRKYLRDRDEDFSFLWRDEKCVDNFIEHIQESLCKFKILIEIRAAGLHNGNGPSYDASVVKANDVYLFLRLLARCKKIKPYIMPIPEPVKPVLDRFALIEDLNAKIASCSEQKEKVKYLRDLYLILPYIPDDEPDWIKALARVQIAPKKDDLTYLVKNLSRAHPIYLYKDNHDGDAIAAKIDQSNRDAIPIAIQDIKKSFSQKIEIIRSESAAANGRYNSGLFEPASCQSVLDLFVSGIGRDSFGSDPGKLTAQDVWPFVSSALSQGGTIYPIWFIIQECKELHKLISILHNITTMNCPKVYITNYKKIEQVLSRIDDGNMTDKYIEEICLDVNKTIEKSYIAKRQLNEKNTTYSSPSFELKQAIGEYVGKNIDLIQLINKLNLCLDEEKIKKYWANKAMTSAIDQNDIEPLVLIFRSPWCQPNYKTIIRKNLKAIDMMTCRFFVDHFDTF